jgi:peptide/nickel transport system permease protein
MWRYVIRRTVQMIPTVFGVILITFILFNVAGGSPAAVTLGKHVEPRSLEEFDEVRGFNKPLFFGNWTTTRAYDHPDFRQNAGPWRRAPEVEWAGEEGGYIRIPAAAEPTVFPLAFALRPATGYRLRGEYRMTGDASAALVFPGLGKIELPFSKHWKKFSQDFQTLENPAPDDLQWAVAGGGLELREITLRRRTAHFLDSQLWFYLRQIARFDFGVSSSTNQRVSRLLLAGLIPSLCLTVPMFFIEILAAIAISLICAFFRNRWLDRAIVVLCVAMMSINYIVWIVAGQYLLAYRLGAFPVWGFASWHFLALPILIGVISGLGSGVRFYRTIMLDEMYKDYVRTAFAKGVSLGGVLFKHVLKNAMIPIITNVVIAVSFLYTGSLLLESFYGIPGLGYLSISAVNSSDIDIVRAVVLIGSIVFVVANLLSDLCYALVDPRVRLG